MAHRLALDLSPDLWTWWGISVWWPRPRPGGRAGRRRRPGPLWPRLRPCLCLSPCSLAPAVEVAEHDEDGDDDPGHLTDGDGAVVHFRLPAGLSGPRLCTTALTLAEVPMVDFLAARALAERWVWMRCFSEMPAALAWALVGTG